MISRKKFCCSPKRLIFELLKRPNILCIPSVKVWKYRKLYPILDEQETYNKVYIQQSVPCLSTSVYWTPHQTKVENSLSKITRPRMIEHTDVHFRTHWNVAKRSWHFLPLRFVPMYISYAIFYERVYVVAGRSSLSLFQAVGDEDPKVKGTRKVGGAGKMKSWRDIEPVIICFYIDLLHIVSSA